MKKETPGEYPGVWEKAYVACVSRGAHPLSFALTAGKVLTYVG